MAEIKWINILLIAAVAYMVLGGNLNFGGGTPVTGNGDGTSQPPIITTSTVLTVVATDALQSGRSIPTPTTTRASINGAAFTTITSGTSTASQGDTMKLLVTNYSMHAAYLPNLVVPSKTTYVIPVTLKQNASASVTVFSTNNVVLQNNYSAASGYNQTVASGGSYNLKIRIDGQDKKSTNPMRCVLESTDGTKMDKMILSGLPGATYVGQAKPSFYTLAGTGSQVWIYDIDEISGAVSPEGTVTVMSKTSQSLAGTYAKITCFSKEYFLDSNTGLVGEPAIEDSLGTAQYVSTASYTFGFNA